MVEIDAVVVLKLTIRYVGAKDKVVPISTRKNSVVLCTEVSIYRHRHRFDIFSTNHFSLGTA